MKKLFLSFFFTRKSLVAFVFLLSSPIHFHLSAQNKLIDSLREVLKTEKDDTNKVNTLNALCSRLWRAGNYDSSMMCTKSTLELAERLGFKFGEAKAWNTMGIINDDRGNYNEAIKCYLKALGIYREIGNKWGIAGALGNIGDVYNSQGDFTKALDYGLQGLAMAQEIGNKEDIAADYISIAVIYLAQGYYPRALEYDFKALALCQEIGYKEGIATALGNIGTIYDEQNNNSKALEYELKALDAYLEAGDKVGIASTLSNMGNVYDKEGDHNKALESHLKSMEIDKELGNKEGIANNLTNIGAIYQATGDYPLALEYLNKAFILFRELGDPADMADNIIGIGYINYRLNNYGLAKDILDSGLTLSMRLGLKNIISLDYANLSAVDSATGNYKSALDYYKRSVIYRDSVENEANTKKTVQAEMNYEFEQKQAAGKAEQDKKDTVAEQERNKQKVIRNSFIGGFVLMLALAFFIFWGYRQKQKDNVIITQQKEEVIKQKALVEHQKALVEEKNRDILDSITYAKRLQDAILPPISIIEQYLPESFVLYKPKDIVAGDFYWMEKSPLPVGEGQGEVVLIAAADCTGHGVPGALVSVVCSNALNRTVKEFHITEPGKILDKVRELVIETFEKSDSNVQDGMDISLLAISHQPLANSFEIQWSGAYNSLWYIHEGEMREVAADKQPIGVYYTTHPFNTHNLSLQKGDTLYLFTDGYADQFGGEKGKKFKYKQLQEKLLAINQLPLAEQKDILNNEFEKWKGGLEQVDDVLIVGIRI